MKTGPKDFFLYLSITITLYASVVALVNLLFSIIDATFPDVLFSFYYTGGTRAAIATLIIIFPLYLLLTHLSYRDLYRNPAKKDLWVRRWLTYLTIFLAAIALIVDLVVLVNTFLGGEITTRFILKALAVLVVAGATFGFYMYDMRRGVPKKTCMTFTWIAVAAVLATIICGFIVMGSPSTQRELRFDEERVQDLSTIQFQITEYWRVKEQLPESLDMLSDELRGFVVPTDPETDEPYEYRSLSTDTFELCATFTQPSIGKGEVRSAIGGPYNDFGTLQTFEHDAGRACFERTIDPDFFPKPVR